MSRKVLPLLIILSIALAGGLLLDKGGQTPEVRKSMSAAGLRKHKPSLQSTSNGDHAKRLSVLPGIKKLHTLFIANHGQFEEKVKFFAKAMGTGIFITHDGHIEYASAKDAVIRERLVNGKILEVKGETEAVTKVGYFKGKEPSNWRSNIPAYDSVSFGEVYDGIEMKLRANGDNVEKLFYVKPDATPEEIRFKVDGAGGLRVNGEGELEITDKTGNVRFTKPLAYQEINDATGNTKEYVEVAYVVNGNEYGFELGDYDRTRELIIDPLLASTFLGGSGDDIAYAMTIDKEGFVYVCGETSSADLAATSGGNEASYAGDSDAYIAKLSSDLKTLVALAYIGGSARDGVSAIGIDPGGNLFVAGSSMSADFPTTAGAYATAFMGGEIDGIVAKFDSNLTSLLASTYVGGNGQDAFGSLAIDDIGHIFVAGTTSSDNITVYDGAYDNTLVKAAGGPCDSGLCSNDSLIVKLDNDLRKVIAATYLGGSGRDAINSIKMGPSGVLYVAGMTESKDFPVSNGAYGQCGPGPKGFVSKFDPNLTTLQASTCIGGSLIDSVKSIAMDGNDNVIVAGYTYSKDFPTTSGAYSSTITNFVDIFISRLSGDLTSILSSTYLGGHENVESPDAVYNLQVDAVGNIYIVGAASSKDFPVSADAFDVTCGADGKCNRKGVSPSSPTDAFISVLNGDMTTLVASTYFGGSGSSAAHALTLDPSGNIIVAGYTTSADLPTTKGVYQPRFNKSSGRKAAFIAKFDPKLSSNVIRQALDVMRAGTGSGSINSSSSGINCGTKCSAYYLFGKKITLRAKADIGSAFQQWSGACSGTLPSCIVKMDSDRTVTASFMKYDPEISTPKIPVVFGKSYINRVTRKKGVSIKNVGKGILTISGISVDSSEFSLGNWGGFWPSSRQLNPKKEFTLAVLFTPASAGEKTATLTITSDDPDNPTKTVTLRGTGK